MEGNNKIVMEKVPLSLSFLRQREEEAFKAFDEAYLKYHTFVLAYSGGKDSTVAAILFYKWVKARGIGDINVVLLHNDTLSEIHDMEMWALYFMQQFEEKMKRLGIKAVRVIASPSPTETWYWRVFIRGYPASTFNFRWCVDLLKVEPTFHVLRRLDNYILVVGSRDEESAARAKSMQNRFGSCMKEGSCLGVYFAVNNDVPKIAPIRFWSLEEVWHYLRAEKEFDISPIFRLYLLNGNLGVRYGCWHCTLVKRQWGNYIDERYLYAEAVRILYRVVSDMEELRTPKNSGYSRLGPLNALGRSVIFNAVKIAEELGSKIFYGLDVEVKYGKEAFTLRQLFYQLYERKADRVIAALDPTDRRIPISQLRNLKSHVGWKDALNAINEHVKRKHIDEKVKEKVFEILNEME